MYKHLKQQIVQQKVQQKAQLKVQEICCTFNEEICLLS